MTVGTTYYYKVIATNSFSTSVASSEVSGTIQASSAIIFVSQPISLMVLNGSTATFSVVVSGGQAYQWECSTNQGANWIDILSATEPSWTSTPIATYQVEATDNVAAPLPWPQVNDSIPSGGVTTTYTETETGEGQRFYKIKTK